MVDMSKSLDLNFNQLGLRGLFYGGGWHKPVAVGYAPTLSPGSGRNICDVAQATAPDVDAAVAAARSAFPAWQAVLPLERARILRSIADVIRRHSRELVEIDAENCGNPVSELMGDAATAIAMLEFFAGLVTEMKGQSIPSGPNAVNFSLRQPMGVVARILAYNHPFMFCAAKIAAPLAAGNTVIVKPPEQAPLSALRLAELLEDVLPPGVFNVLPGGSEAGSALAEHPHVAKVSVIGSVAAGRNVMRAASETIKPVLLELGGKNALIAFPDADPEAVADAMVQGMNLGWCGQSCGSTSRAYVQEAIYETVLGLLPDRIGRYKPGVPTDPGTTMGALISENHLDRVLDYIASAKAEGARLLTGGGRPSDPVLSGGYYLEPTVFCDVTSSMRIAREEIFGPVLSVLKWTDEQEMLAQVNALDFGLTCSIWSRDIDAACRTALAVEAGFVWINEVSKHYLGAPYGGVKQSGIGREECLDELISFTQEKNIHIRISPAS